MTTFLRAATAALCLATPALAQTEVTIHHLSVERDLPPTLSNLDPRPEGLSRDGAAVGLADNATTGRFMNQTWTLTESVVPLGDDPAEAARAVLGETPFLVIDAPAEAIAAIAALPEAEGAILFNATEGDAVLRGEGCSANLLHTAPSTAMRTDALAQFLVMRRWEELPMIVGTYPQDLAYAESLRRSLAKFGLEIAEEKTWAFDADMRRNAPQEVPLFTQGFGDYDALLVADALDDFARYIPYNTWRPRPVVGSEGLTAVAWAPVVEAWGAAQLQNRFEEAAGREMEPEDYGAWAALRALGEAVTRTQSADPATLRAYMLGPDFELAGFKGRPLTFRTWDGQLRQPIPLVHARALVASAPLEGFLHQRTELDTLGVDEPETDCTAFQ
jgi:ABC transporter substrate binding protein (PQQ-dependent alcohol dehydrogenase system)